MPRPVTELAKRLWPQSGEMPSSLVKVRPAHWEDTHDEFNGIAEPSRELPESGTRLHDTGKGGVGGAGDLVFLDPGILRRTAWLVAVTLVPFGLAWLCWTLSRIVASARHGDPFDKRNARRLAVAGGLVAFGPPLAALFQQVVLRLMLANSTAAGKADIWFRGEACPH